MSSTRSKRIARTFVAFIATAGLLTCGPACDGLSGPTVPETPRPVSFSQDVQPIITTACAGCHSPGGLADLFGIEMFLRAGEAYDAIVNKTSVVRSDLTLVVPGDSAASLFYLKVVSDTPPIGDRMPRSAPVLTDEELATIRDWIDEGAEDN